MGRKIIIVGAGPAGIALAYLLATRGIAVTLIEQEVQFDRVFRGEGLMPAGVQALIDMGLGDCLSQIPHRPLDAWDFVIDGQRRMRVVEPWPPNGSPPTHIIHQSALLAAIAERTQPLGNFQFYPGWQVQTLLRQANRIIGVTASHNGQTREFSGDLVIAADGRYSRLRQLAGLPLQPAETQFDVLWFKLPAPAEMLCETVFTVCLQRQRQFAFYPSWDERLQIGWIVEKGAGKRQRDRDWIAEFVPALPPKLAAHFDQHRSELVGPIFLDVIVGCAPLWSAPGLLLMGDAAHPMAPNRAQGINMAFRDAIAIANHLVPWCQQGGHTDTLTECLTAIQTERQPEITTVQQLQLEEWEKIALITASPLTYQPFKGLATALGRLGITQAAWLYQQRYLRYGSTPVLLKV
ncbi:FAD-binding protein [Leptolyngbya iicbica LK]|uniref:FAD-binding protein n=3 Tax=Cyanophyceae TaxID=3028117 RepID=A0A4Q7E225_9CYAN|nr:FAD-dependent monooxygenase [Leptolyngbya sp. LK]RZM75620.1 FAD-binding protein [Leptolyngbya sp. LK]